MQRLIMKARKTMIKIKARHIFNIGIQVIGMQTYLWAMLQKPPVNNFGWINNTSQFNEDYIQKL